jgi:hypothetical protein
VLGELARTQRTKSTIDYPRTSIRPRYFLINGETGVDATRNEQFTIPVVPQHQTGEQFAGVLLRCVNTGVAVHSLHWHGNHVFAVMKNAVPAPKGLVFERDIQRMEPLSRVDVILPAHTGYDAFPPLNENHPKSDVQHFPMHCHAEMSQTAGGGSYPFGMLTDWHLVRDETVAAQVLQQIADDRRDGQRRVPETDVQAAIDQRVDNSRPGSASSGSSAGGDDKSSSSSGSGGGGEGSS